MLLLAEGEGLEVRRQENHLHNLRSILKLMVQKNPKQTNMTKKSETQQKKKKKAQNLYKDTLKIIKTLKHSKAHQLNEAMKHNSG